MITMMSETFWNNSSSYRGHGAIVPVFMEIGALEDKEATKVTVCYQKRKDFRYDIDQQQEILSVYLFEPA
ncbi:hypothetical protein HRG84_07985 [Flavisolibacter sp. BT320]|nr:hypothetical protein [Flavisolibacter longurius]